MIGDEDDFDDLRRRLNQLELLVAAIIAGSSSYDGSEYRYIVDFLIERGGRYSPSRSSKDFSFLLERLARAGRGDRSRRVAEGSSSLRRQFDRLAEDQRSLNAAFFDAKYETDETIEKVTAHGNTLSAEMHEWLALSSLGLDMNAVRVKRFVALRVYLSDDEADKIDQVSEALNEFIDALDFEITDEFPEIRGSWYKRWFARTKDVVTQPEVSERIQKLERAMELKVLVQPQADIDEKQAAAVSKLMKAVDNVPSAAIQVGSILLIKISQSSGPIVQVRTLTQVEMMHLENNQALLTSPPDLLKNLSLLCSGRTIQHPRTPPNEPRKVQRRRKKKPDVQPHPQV